MKMNRKENKINNNHGSAMLIAIVVSIVVIVFCLSLLLVSYSLFTSTSRKLSQTQCRELAKTISIELEKELTYVNYDTYDDEKLACEAGENPLWFYIRYNICQQTWPYFDDSIMGHKRKDAYRYFELNASGGDSTKYEIMADDISICMYWVNEGDYTEDKEETLLCVEVTCTKHQQSATVTSFYVLGCGTYTDGNMNSDNIAAGNNVDAINPSGNIIDTTEHWTWSLQERK